MTVALSCSGIRKRFGGDAEALSGVDLEVAEGEFAVLLGPSGCGKSTLLRIIAGIEEPDAGDIHIAGRRMNEIHPRDRDIAMVFQNYALYPVMSVRENLAFSLRIRKTPPDEIERRVRETAEILGLGELLDRRPAQLSGGQRQRVAMGRAMMRKPRVFLFDEPLSNLDAKLRASVRAEIKTLHRDLRTTTVYVTHDQIEAMTMADKIVVMRNGGIEQVGGPREVYRRPQTVHAATFVGTPEINLLKAVPDDGGCRVDGAIFPPPPGVEGLPPEFLYGIRPHDIDLGADGGATEGEVFLVEPTGGSQIIHIRFGASAGVVAQAPEDFKVRAGDACRFRPRPERAHLFNPQSGRRIAAQKEKPA